MRPHHVLILLAALVPSSVSAAEFRAAAARADITPPTGHAMWGYGARRDAPAMGVLDPLRARALVLEQGGKRLALVSLDLGRAPPRRSLAAIRERIRPANIDALFLVASHTHHGPVLEIDTWPTPETSYVRRLERQLADLVLEAVRGLRPARLGIVTKEVGFNRNRHSKRRDASVDRDFTVLRVEGEDGRPIAHALNFAAHPTMREAMRREFSADYPGPLCDLVERETGAPCLFLQGAAGDLSPNAGSERGPEAFGRRLGREVLNLAAGIRCAAPTGATLEIAEEEFTFGSRVELSSPGVKLAYSLAFFPALVDFYEAEYREGVRPRLTVALLGGQIGFVGVSGEFFASHALNLKRRARLEHLLFLGYCNDYQQYFPTIEAAAEGGYGADPLVATAEVGAGEKMMDRALVHLFRMRGRLAK